MTTADRLLTRLTVAADEQLVVPVRDFCSRVLARAGIPPAALRDFDLLVEEACLHVVRNAFDPGAPGSFDIAILARPNRIAIVVEDQGLPEDPRLSLRRDPEQIGVVLMRAFAHEVVFRNLGREGKRLELIRRLGPGLLEAPEPATAPETAAIDQVAIRLMAEADAPSLARCLWRAHGYGHPEEQVYFPDRVAQMLRARLLASAVAVNEASEVVGHVGLLFDEPGARVASCSVAVVDPRYRGHGLFGTLQAHMLGWAKRQGLHGIVCTADATQTETQRRFLDLGAVETALLPDAAASGPRGNLLRFHLGAGRAPERPVHPPARHAAMLRAIYDRLDLARDWRAGAEPDGEPAAHTRLVLRAKPDQGRAEIRIGGYGLDAIDVVRAHVKELERRGIACTVLELPLADPLTAELCTEFERMGFGFAGLGVEAADGDVLALVRLRGAAEPQVAAASEHGAALADYVLAMRAEAAKRQD